MRIEIVEGTDAARTLSTPAFKEAWKALHTACPWATVCQSPEFVQTWYATYAREYQPFLVTGYGEDDRLTGLLTLARRGATDPVVVAGTHHAEYQVWLARSGDGDAFIEGAIDALRERCPGTVLRLTYTPPGTPMDWLAPGRRFARMVTAQRLPRALRAIGDGSEARSSLKKKATKSRLNRLRRLGALTFRRLSDPGELETYFDEILLYGTLRVLAVHRESEFQQDELKREFYVRLMREHGLIHATVLEIDGRLVSAHVGVHNRDQLWLGIFTHAPALAAHSPGKLHLLMLAEALAQEGIATFDLTPSGNYKDRFATHHDEVHAVQIFLGRVPRLREAVRERLAAGVKGLASLAGTSGPEIRERLASMQQRWRLLRPADVVRVVAGRTQRRLRQDRELRLYTVDPQSVAVPAGVNDTVRRDHLADLLTYRQAEAQQPTRRQFLQTALARLEEGAHVYTVVRDGVLLHYGWLLDRQERSELTEVGQTLYLPPNSAVLFDFHTRRDARRQGLFTASLRRMLGDAARIPGTGQIWICVLANNMASRRVIEAAGFRYRFSFFSETRFGRTRRWTDAPAAFVTAPTGPGSAVNAPEDD